MHHGIARDGDEGDRVAREVHACEHRDVRARARDAGAVVRPDDDHVERSVLLAGSRLLERAGELLALASAHGHGRVEVTHPCRRRDARDCDDCHDDQKDASHDGQATLAVLAVREIADLLLAGVVCSGRIRRERRGRRAGQTFAPCGYVLRKIVCRCCRRSALRLPCVACMLWMAGRAFRTVTVIGHCCASLRADSR